MPSVTPKKTVIRDAHLIDGSNSPGRPADVTFVDGTITAIDAPGKASTAHAHRVIEADGLLLTPGWVDIHTHYDAQATWDPYLTPSSWHGVTTAVMGNCGVGFAPAQEERHDWLIELMEGVEDIPGSAMTEGLTWGWTSFTEYMDVLAKQPRIMDLGVQIAHGALRAFVMGDRGAANEPATDNDIRTMARHVHEAITHGALGFSTSRTPIHRSKSGELVPGTHAETNELYGIAEAISQAGGGVIQFAPEHQHLISHEWGWMREVAARHSNVTVSVNLNQADEAPHVWKEVLKELDRAHNDGLNIIAQVAGRSIGVLMCLEGSFHPLAFHPAWQDIAALPLAEKVKALRTQPLRDKFKEIPRDGGFFEKLVYSRLWKFFPVTTANIDYEPDIKTDSVEAISAARRVDPMDLMIDHLLTNEGKGIIYLPFFNYNYGDLSMTHDLLAHPHTRNGLSDAGAHCGAICDGGMPTFMLTHWARDRQRGPRHSLEYMVHRQTRATALAYGFTDRGFIAPSMRADLNLIDYEKLAFDMPYMAYDLPASGRRLVQKARGYVGTFCNGMQTVNEDEFTGELPGVLMNSKLN